MTATFLVEIDLPDISPQVLMDVAGELQEDLGAMGMEVISVKPWARPSMPQTNIIGSNSLGQPTPLDPNSPRM